MLWLHGGGFTSGGGGDGMYHGGMLASRSDVVTVSINYRLGALGFLALRNGTTGNYALGDVITALKWVQQNIAAFGGDPNRVTVFGQSAGANLLQALLQTPQAAGLFHGAIVQSGKPIGKATARSTIEEMRPHWLKFAAARGCRPASPASDTDVVSCLRGLPASSLIGSVVGTRPIQDNVFLSTRQMDISRDLRQGGWVNRVPVMVGYMRDELGALGPVPTVGKSLEESMRIARVPEANISTVLKSSDIWPLPQGADATRNLSMAVANEANQPSRRCGLQATMYAWARNQVFPSVYGYVFDTRSYSSPAVGNGRYCEPANSASLAAGNYGHCHSGDLFPTWNVSHLLHSSGLMLTAPSSLCRHTDATSTHIGTVTTSSGRVTSQISGPPLHAPSTRIHPPRITPRAGILVGQPRPGRRFCRRASWMRRHVCFRSACVSTCRSSIRAAHSAMRSAWK